MEFTLDTRSHSKCSLDSGVDNGVQPVKRGADQLSGLLSKFD